MGSQANQLCQHGCLKDLTDFFFKKKEINLDNFTFKLFYRGAAGLCILASVFSAGGSYFGDPIACKAERANTDELKKLYQDHCWIHGTERIGFGANGKDDQKHFDCVLRDGSSEGESGIHFYLWVPFVLFIQTVMFQIPNEIWKNLEGGLMESFYSEGKVKTKNKGRQVKNKKGELEWVEETDDSMVSLFSEKAGFFEKIKGTNRFYFFSFLACEVLNVVMVAIIGFQTDVALGGNFRKYGLEVYGHYVNNDPEFDVMCNAFPTVASCDLKRYGTGAKKENINGFCILSQNIINQKMYLVLWFWYILIVSCGIVQLLKEAVILAVPAFRNRLITRSMGSYVTKDVLQFLERECNSGDWFVLNQLRKNSDKHFLGQFMQEIAKKKQ